MFYPGSAAGRLFVGRCHRSRRMAVGTAHRIALCGPERSRADGFAVPPGQGAPDRCRIRMAGFEWSQRFGYTLAPKTSTDQEASMIETNPILARIRDLDERASTLRGYL